MSTEQQNLDVEGAPSGGGLAVTDIYFVLFRRKWIIVLGLILGVLAAAALWKIRQPPYVSDAKLLVKFVIETPPQATAQQINKIEDNGASVIGSEIEILTSQDIARHVAAVVGPERIVARGENSDITNDAAAFILKKLNATPLQRTKIIYLEFQHKDPAICQIVLNEVIDAYFKKHDDVHTARLSDKTLNQQVDQLRMEITNCEARLKLLKEKAGVSSLEDSKKEGIKLASNVRQQLFEVRAELAKQRATRDAMHSQGIRVTNAASISAADVPPDKLDEYKAVLTQLEVLNRRRAEYSGLSDTVPQVATNLLQIRAAAARKTALELAFPPLPKLMLPGAALPAPAPVAASPATLAYELPALESKALELSNQLASVELQLKQIQEVETEVGDLERRRASLQKELEQTEFARLEFKRKSTLDASQNASISRVQEPSPPSRDFGKLFKTMGMAVFGGMGFGIALAFILEMFLDRSLKRPKDVETALAVPLFLSIPYTNIRGLLPASDSAKRKALPAPAAGTGGGGSSALVPTDVIKPPEANQELKPYHDALRDRLMNYFDVRDMTHKPKLIAVTSCRDGAGVSTVASGLAASLSETGDGNVLLVDMRGQQGAAHAFYHGKPAIGLAEALEDETRGGAMVNENLYVVSAGSVDKKLEKVFPKQFSQFVPKLKASDYDYIIFDMPPVGQTSVTAKVARFMDMVLMVVESENTDKDAAKKAGALLADANATVATVLNKQRSYVPGWLHQELQ